MSKFTPKQFYKIDPRSQSFTTFWGQSYELFCKVDHFIYKKIPISLKRSSLQFFRFQQYISVLLSTHQKYYRLLIGKNIKEKLQEKTTTEGEM